MKRILIFLLTTCVISLAQAKTLIISYGDVTTDVENTNVEASGWRADLVFEPPPKGGNLIHGFDISHIETKTDYTTVAQTTHYKLKSLPLYYQPKMLFDQKALKGFLKGALGFHFSDYDRSGVLGSFSAEDVGFFGGLALGAMYLFNEKMFIDFEYE